ncbi:MAG: YncE family protein [Methyloprofundus sp.]|nr:YncE family protein [Methyloprofundus sp.]
MLRITLALLLYGFASIVVSDPYFYINQQQGEGVSVFKRTDLTLKTTIPTLKGPAGIAISPHNPWLAVTYPEQGMVSFIDSEKLIPLEHLSVGGSPFGAVFANNHLFISDWSSNTVKVIHPGTGKVIKKIAVGKSPAGIATNACESQIWVLNREGNTVSVLDSRSYNIIKTIAVGSAPFALAMDERFAYIANSQGNTLSIVDLADLIEIKRIQVGRMPYDVAVDRKQHKVFVSNQLENTVSVLDSRTHQLINNLKTGAYPENIAVDEENQRLLVLNWFDGSLTVFDSQTDEEIKRIEVADGSRAFGQFVAKPVVCLADDNQ